jgi:two-component system CheB/CheR fusion protein
MAKKIVEHHGGWIKAESEGPGRGAKISFTIPQ